MFSPQGCTFTWGTSVLDVTSFQVNAQSGGEIDMTSMSSEVVSDPDNSNKKYIVLDFDTYHSVKYGTDVSVEFFASGNAVTTNWYFDSIGKKKVLSVMLPRGPYGLPGAGGGHAFVNKTALLTSVTLGAAAGEYVKGSAVFKISGR